MSTVTLIATFLLPTDLAPEPQPPDLSPGDWALPLIVGTAVLVVLVVTAVVVLRRRRGH